MADPAPGGVSAPNYTQTPNEIYDLLPQMGEAELRVVLVVCRKTFGWHKRRDRISLSQLIKATGMSHQGVINGIEKAVERGLLKRQQCGTHANGKPLFTYELIVNDVEYDPREILNNVDHDTQRSRPSIVNDVEIQKKDVKKLAKENDNGVMANGAIHAQPPVSDSSITAKETESHKEPTEQQAWFQAVCDAVGWDYRTLTKAQSGQVAQTVGVLKRAEYTLSDMSAFQDWWFKKDFRGLRGSHPTINQLRAEIGKSRRRKVDNYPTEEERAAYLRQTRRE